MSLTVRTLESDPPTPTTLSVFIHADSKHSRELLESVLTEIYDRIGKESGKQIIHRDKYYAKQKRFQKRNSEAEDESPQTDVH